MKVLRDSIVINAEPEVVYEALKQIFSNTEEYKKWHKDHVSLEWVKGPAFELGSILIAKEYLHGRLHNLKFQLTKVEEMTCIEYRLLFPYSIICPTGSFEIIRQNGFSLFTASLNYRFNWLLDEYLHDHISGVKLHMKEEGEELRKMIELGN